MARHAFATLVGLSSVTMIAHAAAPKTKRGPRPYLATTHRNVPGRWEGTRS
jgi:hypothetical protein